METIVIQPKNKKELAFINEFLLRTKIKATLKNTTKKPVLTEKPKEEILSSIERGYKQARLHAAGKVKLQSLKEFLDDI